MACGNVSNCAAAIVSRMRKRTALRRVLSPDHLEQQRPHGVPVEQKEYLEPRFVIMRWGSSVKASLGATRKPR